MAHKARRRFSQNFLTDEGILHGIVHSLNLGPRDQLLEIGPGQGALTRLLAKHLPRFYAIEIDRDLVPRLRQEFPGVQVIEADILKFDFSALFGSTTDKWRVVGNLPYNISTPLLDVLLAHAECIQDMHFMLQKEVVDRLCAQVNTKSWGRLGIMMQYLCDIEKILDVSPQSFTPAPKVNSAFVRLSPKVEPLQLADRALFKKVLRTAFSQRRKTLRNALAIYLVELPESTVDRSVRPENLEVSDWVALSNELSAAGIS